MVSPRVKPVFGTTTPIRYPDGQGGGTGFFFNYEEGTYLISNRHIFEPEEFTPLEAKIWLRDIQGLNTRPQTLDLYRNGSAKWYGHPESEEIDVAVLPLDTTLSTIDDVMNGEPQTGSLAFDKDYILPDAVSLNDSVVIVGYPGDFIDPTTYFPVKRNAVIASPYGIPFENKPCFVTDARMHNGTSGSPIILNHPIMHREGYELSGDRDKGVYLLGIHSASFYNYRARADESDEDRRKWEYDLNLGWYPELIEQILSTI